MCNPRVYMCFCKSVVYILNKGYKSMCNPHIYMCFCKSVVYILNKCYKRDIALWDNTMSMGVSQS